MDDYLSKPVALGDLQAALTRWMPAGERAPPVARSKAPRAATAAEPAAVLDLGRMREIFGEIDGSAIALLNRYVETTAPLIAAIATSVAGRAGDDARKAVHSAKGASRSAGADELAELCVALEAALKRGAWDEVAAAAAQLAPAFARVKQAVSQIRPE
jgi:HPt (histidine-containing phosphotransfer) domain-containing protein